jgi:hypothetical protein
LKRHGEKGVNLRSLCSRISVLVGSLTDHTQGVVELTEAKGGKDEI